MVCLFCQAREQIERANIEDGDQPADRTINVCECGGVKRFIAYGAYPTNPAEAAAFISLFLDAFEYYPWPKWKKTWPTFVEVMVALERHTTLAPFAAELDVSLRTAQTLTKWATGMTFREYQIEKRNRAKPRWGIKLERRRR